MQTRSLAYDSSRTSTNITSRTERRLPSLSSFSLFEGVSDADMERLESASQTRSFAKGQMVFLPGDAADRIYIVASGRIKLSRLSDSGKELILDLLEPGSVFGEADVVAEASRDGMAEAVEASVLWTIPAGPFRALMARNPAAFSTLMTLIARRQRSLESKLLDVVHKNAPERLAGLLLELAKRYGMPDARGTMLRIKLSQTTLGNWLGVSREIVNHTFSDLKRRGVIDVVEGRVIIKDVDELASKAA